MEIKSYLEVLKSVYLPAIGSIWKAPNRIWKTGFASNKTFDGLHPALVEKVNTDKIQVRLVPGTSKDYKKGSCVYIVDLNNCGRKSFFLLKLSMPFLIEDLLDLEKGWDNKYELDEKQLNSFNWQIKICKG